VLRQLRKSCSKTDTHSVISQNRCHWASALPLTVPGPRDNPGKLFRTRFLNRRQIENVSNKARTRVELFERSFRIQAAVGRNDVCASGVEDAVTGSR
jgi:hypothetical protein